MKTAISHLRLIGKYLLLNIASAMEYRASFFSALFAVCLSDSAFLFFWWVAFSQIGGRIGGCDFQDMAFLWSATAVAFGLSGALFGNMHRISRLIVTGEMDAFLLQPKDTLINMLCAHTDISAWGDVVYGVTLMAVTGQGVGGWTGFLLAAVFGTALMTATAVIFGSLAFWLGDAETAGGMAMEFIVNFCIYPEGIFRGGVKLLLYTVIPAGYMVHVPLRLARGGPVWYLPLLIAVTAAYCLFAAWLFRRGLRRYESGNLIMTRT